jgi:hypothetical protein
LNVQPNKPIEQPNAWLFTPAATLLQYLIDEQIITVVTQRALSNVSAWPAPGLVDTHLS